jgi:hypothetical protein
LRAGNAFGFRQWLIDYIEKHRRQDFERNLCRKFLGYALGRSVLSDEPLLQVMQKKLSAERRFSVFNSAGSAGGIMPPRFHSGSELRLSRSLMIATRDIYPGKKVDQSRDR